MTIFLVLLMVAIRMPRSKREAKVTMEHLRVTKTSLTSLQNPTATLWKSWDKRQSMTETMVLDPELTTVPGWCQQWIKSPQNSCPHPKSVPNLSVYPPYFLAWMIPILTQTNSFQTPFLFFTRKKHLSNCVALSLEVLVAQQIYKSVWPSPYQKSKNHNLKKNQFVS